jgi:hypothetical protein
VHKNTGNDWLNLPCLELAMLWPVISWLLTFLVMVLLVQKASKLWHVTGHILYAPSRKQMPGFLLCCFKSQTIVFWL